MKRLLVILLVVVFHQGINAQCFPDRHNTSWNDGWLSCQAATNPNANRGQSHWIQYDLGAVYVLGQTHFWNSNIPDSTNRGFQEIAIDYSLDGLSWTSWGSFTLSQANGSGFYEGEQGPSLNGTAARYVLLTGISNYGASCYGLSEVRFEVQNSPVPVDIAEFKVKCNNGLTEIIWKSSTEINNHYYSLERSFDGRNWDLIETVEAKGNSTKESNYSLLDKEYNPGSKFYRLSQTDYNGRAAIIDVREIECGEIERNINVSPNPFNDHLNVRIEMPLASIFDYVMLDALGRVVKEGSIDSLNPIIEFSIDASGLIPGTYMLNIIYPNSKEQVKLVKM
jgi:hypothetical protein